MSNTIAGVTLIVVLASAQHAEAKRDLPDPIFVAPEFYSLDFDKIYIFYSADEFPKSEEFPDGVFKDKDDRRHAPRGVRDGLKRMRGYKTDFLRPKQTAYTCTSDDINSEDRNWMSVLEAEGRRFVFLTVVKSFDIDQEKKKNSILTLSGYLFDTQKRTLLWHGESTQRLGSNFSKFLSRGLYSIAIKFEDTLGFAGYSLGLMFPKNKKRKQMGVD